jgi:hypothetical protein
MLLAIGSPVAIASVGLFYMPSVLAMAVAAGLEGCAAGDA